MAGKNFEKMSLLYFFFFLETSLTEDQEQIQFLLDLNFHVPAIAYVLGKSERTVRRRMEACGLRVRNRYSQLSDAALDGEVRAITLNVVTG